MKQLLALVFVVVAACKGEEVAALVNCEVTEGPTVECAIKQTKGRARMEVCWDFSVTCPNKATLEARHICQTLQGGGARNVVVPTEKLELTGECEGTGNAAVTGMTINGEPAK